MPSSSWTLLSAIALCTVVHAADSNPLGAVVDLLTELSAKVKSEGEAEAKAFSEYNEWCDDFTTEKGFEIKTAKSSQESLEAKISQLTGDIEAATSKIDDLAADIASNTAELKNATLVRDSEVADFQASEKELVEVIDTLGRAITIIGREMQKKGAAAAAFTQLASKGLSGVLQSLDTLVDAASITGTDKKRLTALIQSTQDASEDDEELGAPAAAVYTSKSGSIVDTLEDLKEKAEEQLSSLRKAETNAAHNYNLVKQSLDDQTKYDNKELEEEKANKNAAKEGLAGAEGDLKETVADLKATEEALATAQATCAEVSANHEATVAAREEELKVIAEATDILKSTTSGAVNQAYSFLQVASGLGIQSRADLARSEVLTIIKKLAQQQHSTALAQLASRIQTVMRHATRAGEGPFDKVKSLINDLVAKLEAEASAEATEKAFCDEETAKSEASRDDLESTISKLTSKIDADTARSTKLKGEVKELQAELAKQAEEEAEMIKIRTETHADYVQAKADYEQGLAGVRQALVTLRDYYAKKETDEAEAAFIQNGMQQPAKPEQFSKAGGSGTSIIGILEVVESDFAKNLAKEESTEATAQEAFDKQTQQNKITKASKEQDIKYKSEEAASADKTISELSTDRETASTEHAAVLEYLGKLNERCVAKPETYESRKQRRDAEIAGLKEALDVLEQTAFIQRQRKGRRMRGALRVAA